MGHQVEVTRRTQAAHFPTSGRLCLSVPQECAGDFFQQLLLSPWQGPIPVLAVSKTVILPSGSSVWGREQFQSWGAIGAQKRVLEPGLEERGWCPGARNISAETGKRSYQARPCFGIQRYAVGAT